MSTFADYIVLKNGPITLSQGQESNPPLSFTLPSDFVVSVGGQARTVLAYKINLSDDSPKEYEIDLNDTIILSATSAEEAARGLWEVLDGDKFRVGQENTVQFRFESGSGTITFSDVVLWFQRTLAV